MRDLARVNLFLFYQWHSNSDLFQSPVSCISALSGFGELTIMTSRPFLFFYCFGEPQMFCFFGEKNIKSNKTKQRTQPRSVRRTGDMCRHLLWMLAAFCSELCSTIGASKRPPPHTPTCWLTVTALQPVVYGWQWQCSTTARI